MTYSTPLRLQTLNIAHYPAQRLSQGIGPITSMNNAVSSTSDEKRQEQSTILLQWMAQNGRCKYIERYMSDFLCYLISDI